MTTAVFRTPANSNYETPVQGNNSTYTGNFDWTRSWTVEKQMLTVHWATGTRSNSDGDQVTYTLPQIEGEHSSKFNYTYKRQDANGVWQSVSSITRVPGQEVDYQVFASLKIGRAHV